MGLQKLGNGNSLLDAIEYSIVHGTEQQEFFGLCKLMRQQGYQFDADSKAGEWHARWTQLKAPGDGHPRSGAATDQNIARAAMYAARNALLATGARQDRVGG